MRIHYRTHPFVIGRMGRELARAPQFVARNQLNRSISGAFPAGLEAGENQRKRVFGPRRDTALAFVGVPFAGRGWGECGRHHNSMPIGHRCTSCSRWLRSGRDCQVALQPDFRASNWRSICPPLGTAAGPKSLAPGQCGGKTQCANQGGCECLRPSGRGLWPPRSSASPA